MVSYENTGWHIFQPVGKQRFLKVSLDKIPDPSEGRIAKLYSEGLNQAQIVHELGVSKQYVSKILGKWFILPERKVTPPYKKPSLVKVYDAYTGIFKRFEKPSGKITITGTEKNQPPTKPANIINGELTFCSP